jgi:hypothetical protein
MTCIRVGSEHRRKGSGFICIPDTETLEIQHPECPNAAAHEPFPRGFLAASEYAEKLMETHTQEAPCPGCGYWHIWVPKRMPVSPA